MHGCMCTTALQQGLRLPAYAPPPAVCGNRPCVMGGLSHGFLCQPTTNDLLLLLVQGG